MFFKTDLVISSLMRDLAYLLICKCFIPLKDVELISFILVFIKYLRSKEQACLTLNCFFSRKAPKS